jgi:hypothetical protein
MDIKLYTFAETFPNGDVFYPRRRSCSGDRLHYHMSTNSADTIVNAIDIGLLTGSLQEMEREDTRLRNMRDSRGMTSIVEVIEVVCP